MTDRLILGYQPTEEVVTEIEAHLKPGELVMREDNLVLGYRLAVSESGSTIRTPANGLVLASGPSFTILREYFAGNLVWTKEPVIWQNFYLNPRVRLDSPTAFGTEAVSEFFSLLKAPQPLFTNFTYFQLEYLRVLNQVNIEGGEITGQVRQQVAKQLLEFIFRNLPTSVGAALAHQRSTEVPEIFANSVISHITDTGIRRSMEGLVDSGLYGRKLEVPIEVEGGSRLIAVDECFDSLVLHYKPRTVVQDIARRQFETD